VRSNQNSHQPEHSELCDAFPSVPVVHDARRDVGVRTEAWKPSLWSMRQEAEFRFFEGGSDRAHRLKRCKPGAVNRQPCCKAVAERDDWRVSFSERPPIIKRAVHPQKAVGSTDRRRLEAHPPSTWPRELEALRPRIALARCLARTARSVRLGSGLARYVASSVGSITAGTCERRSLDATA
jgi:hypothetical protein